ncbi:MAG: bis(5'-nucleosyl)-tetraphosphatase (symmetrical) YqeK [Actinomycetota bacterium]|nr:bis(5'-nucleosyl)-tetraphosphatase (symmetrical) YqeK [Actinomycetota bacterium]
MTQVDALLDDAEDYARERLSGKRYAHTSRVADVAERLARIHSLDPKRARLAALLHDTAREVGKEELLRVAEEEDLYMSDFEREWPILLHGPVAAELARRDLGVEDEEVREAVRHHTTGGQGMGSLALALFVADKIEPARTGPKVEELRDLAVEDLCQAATAALEGSISYNELRGYQTHPKSRETLYWLKNSDRCGGLEV